MACSNSECPDKANDPAPFNRLGECKGCHETRQLRLRADLIELPKRLVHWFGEAEKAYGTNCFYSADIERLIDTKDEDKLKTLGLEKASFPARLKIANNGAADSFVPTSKNFALMSGIQPSKAIRSFIQGRLTVCECEGMIKAVHFNALCDLVGDAAFDVAFADLSICGSGWGIEKAFFDEQKKPIAESDCGVGAWTFLAHTTNSAAKFRDLVNKTKKGSSASGWNLICASDGGAEKNTYFGFGLSGGDSKPKTLRAVKVTMIKECGGNPDDEDWNLYLHFRRQINVDSFLVWLDKRLKLA